MNCHKPLDVDITWVVRCPNCQEKAGVHPRARFNFILADPTASMVVNVSGAFTEAIIGHKAEHLHTASENNLEVYGDIAAEIENKELLCYIRYYTFSQGNQFQPKYTVVMAYTEQDLNDFYFPGTSSPDATSLSCPSSSSPALTTQSEKDNQFFTPSTKKALDEIPLPATTKPTQAIGVSRKLDFDVNPPVPNTPIPTDSTTQVEDNALSSQHSASITSLAVDTPQPSALTIETGSSILTADSTAPPAQPSSPPLSTIVNAPKRKAPTTTPAGDKPHGTRSQVKKPSPGKPKAL